MYLTRKWNFPQKRGVVEKEEQAYISVFSVVFNNRGIDKPVTYTFFVYFFGGLECVNNFFANAARPIFYF